MLPALRETSTVLARVNTASRVAVGVSGGKDSLCTLDVCVRHFGADRVVGFLMYLVQGLECEWENAHRAERRYGVKVHAVPHFDLSRLLKYNVFRPYTVGSEKIRRLRMADVDSFVKRSLDAEWTAWGMRAADSTVRNAMLKRISGIDEAQKRLYPIWTWKQPDVYGYLRHRKLPLPAITGGHQRSGGIGLDPKTLLWVKRECPHRTESGESRCYRKILDVFPFADAAVYKLESAHGYQEKNAGHG